MAYLLKMDPNANLKEQLDLTKRILEADPDSHGVIHDDAARLAELVEALHEWLVGGGFLPADWHNGRRE